jgi:hypothetical protein
LTKKLLLRTVAIGSFFAALSASIYFEFDFSKRMPRQPDPETARTYPVYVNHGYRVFVTESELSQMNTVNHILLPATAIGIAALVWYERCSRSRGR